jgi:hypothetical protein
MTAKKQKINTSEAFKVVGKWLWDRKKTVSLVLITLVTISKIIYDTMQLVPYMNELRRDVRHDLEAQRNEIWVLREKLIKIVESDEQTKKIIFILETNVRANSKAWSNNLTKLKYPDRVEISSKEKSDIGKPIKDIEQETIFDTLKFIFSLKWIE